MLLGRFQAIVMCAAVLTVASPRFGHRIHHRALAGEPRLPLLLLAQIAADVEQTMNESTWRTVNPRAARWFHFLASTGYTLAEVEQRVVNDADDRTAQQDQDTPDGEAARSDATAGPDADDADGPLTEGSGHTDNTEGPEAA